MTDKPATVKLQLTIAFAFILAVVCASRAAASTRVALVPLDNRPVCLTHAVKIADRAGVAIKHPPYAAVGAYVFPGDPDAVLDWIEREAPQTDLLILSIDMAATGGLVSSRTDTATADEVSRRLERLRDIAEKNPGMKIWAFGILQRIARTGTGREKEDSVTAQMALYLKTADEAEATHNKSLSVKSEMLKSGIPATDLEAYMNARRRNHFTNIKSIEMAAAGVFDLLVIGMDDNAVYGPERKELATLEKEIARLGAGEKVIIKPGADELAQLLIARAKLESERRIPKVYIATSDPSALGEIPPFEDRPLNESLDLALTLAGASRAASADGADAVLLVHTADKNSAADARMAAEFVDAGYRVGVADVSAVNMASADFAEELGRGLGDLNRLAGYGGWNTAANSIGTAAAMLLAGGDGGAFLFERFADDALFMGRVRPRIQRQNFPGADEGERYTAMRAALVKSLREESGKFYKLYFSNDTETDVRVDIQIPWFRLFEIDIDASVRSRM